MTSPTDIIAGLIADGHARTAAEIVAAGVHRETLKRAAVAGDIVIQYARGIYCSPTIPDGMGYAATALLNPGGIVCLQSAASIHGISDENPGSIWYAVDSSRTRAKPMGLNRDPVTMLWWTGPAMTVGVDVMTFAGVPVNVTNPARTVVDMVRRDLKAGGGEQSNRALRDFMLHGGDLGDVWAIAKELGCADQFESLLRVAEELGTVMEKPRSM